MDLLSASLTKRSCFTQKSTADINIMNKKLTPKDEYLLGDIVTSKTNRFVDIDKKKRKRHIRKAKRVKMVEKQSPEVN